MVLKVFGTGKSTLTEDKDLYDSIKNIFGFNAGNIFLYKLAFRHKSAAQELKDGFKDSNERLEFLGDAILSAVIAEYLFKKYPFKDEGFLTEMRSRIVSRNQLNKLAVKLGIDKFIETGFDSFSQPKSIFGDAFEALIGAIYLDKGYEVARKVIVDHIVKFHLDIEEIQNTDSNFKSRLIEWSQREKINLEFRLIKENGNGNFKQYNVEVLINGDCYGKGQDYSIKAAEQQAAEHALQKIDVTEI